MGPIPRAATTATDHDDCPMDGEIFWQKIRLLEYVYFFSCLSLTVVPSAAKGRQVYKGNRANQPPSGWGRYMEWMHGVEVRWTNKKAFKAVGIAETAATL